MYGGQWRREVGDLVERERAMVMRGERFREIRIKVFKYKWAWV